jgi:hypothetical protein
MNRRLQREQNHVHTTGKPTRKRVVFVLLLQGRIQALARTLKIFSQVDVLKENDFSRAANTTK